MKLKIKCYAKINLMLKITGIDNKGYHLLDMLNTSISLCDILTVSMRSDGNINVFCPGIDREKNSAFLAAKLFSEKYPCGGFDITIEKNIPLAGGLGGSSADAAGVLAAMKHCFPEAQISDIAAKCGSDVPYMLRGGYAVVGGTGEKVSPFACMESYDIVIAKPKGGVSAAQSYKMFDSMGLFSPCQGGSAEKLKDALICRDIAAIKNLCTNDLFEPSCKVLPEIREIRDLLSQSGAEVALMSGSGSCCFGLFSNGDAALKCQKSISSRGIYARALSTVQHGTEFEVIE